MFFKVTKTKMEQLLLWYDRILQSVSILVIQPNKNSLTIINISHSITEIVLFYFWGTLIINI